MSQTRTHSAIATLQRIVGPPARAGRGALVVLLLANLCLLAYYIGFGYQGYFHSDAATKNLLAQEIYQTGKFFPTDWNYVNGDLMLVFGHLFILPLLPFFANDYALHAVSGLISAGLVLLATWLVSGVISRAPWTRMVCMAIFTSGLSAEMAESLFGQVSYGTVFYSAGFTLVFAWYFLNAQGRARWLWGGLFAVFSMLMFWANPQRAVASYALPLAMAMAVYACMIPGGVDLRWNARVARSGGLLALLVLGSVLGTVLHQWVLVGVNNLPGAGAARWLPFDGMAQNLVHTVHGLFAILGGVPLASRSVISPQGLYEGIRLLATCGLLVLIPLSLVRAFKHGNDGVRFVAVFTIVSLALFLFLHITTTIPDMTDPVTTARYLVVPVLFSLLILVVTVVDAGAGRAYRLLGGAVLVVLATSAFSMNNPFSLALTGRAPDSRQQLIHLLESDGLKYGYGTYWNAGALTVMSGQQVKVRQVLIEQGLPTPMRHLSSNRWYLPDAWHGETFLLLRDGEAKLVDWKALTDYVGQPSRTLKFEDFVIYVFPRNMAAALPRWNEELAGPLSLRISEESFHQIGTFAMTAGGPVLMAQPGQSGYIHFGPYLKLKPGSYEVTFDVETSAAAPASFGTVDVTSEGGAITHASRPLDKTGRQRVSLEFELDHNAADLEVRVFSTGAGRMSLHGIELKPAK